MAQQRRTVVSQDHLPGLLCLPLAGSGLVTKEMNSFTSMCHLFESMAHVLGGQWAGETGRVLLGPRRVGQALSDAGSSPLSRHLCPTQVESRAMDEPGPSVLRLMVPFVLLLGMPKHTNWYLVEVTFSSIRMLSGESAFGRWILGPLFQL